MEGYLHDNRQGLTGFLFLEPKDYRFLDGDSCYGCLVLQGYRRACLSIDFQWHRSSCSTMLQLVSSAEADLSCVFAGSSSRGAENTYLRGKVGRKDRGNGQEEEMITSTTGERLGALGE